MGPALPEVLERTELAENDASAHTVTRCKKNLNHLGGEAPVQQVWAT